MARLDSARLGTGAHRMVEENWKEAARSVATPRECDEDEGMREKGRDIPRKAPTSEILYLTVPYRTAPRRQAATNRSLRLPRLTAPVLSTRGDRDGHAAAVPASSARTTLSKRPDRFGKLLTTRILSALYI